MFAGMVEFLGWFGAVTVLLGYLLFSTGRIANGPVYQLFNLVGGLAVAVNVAAHHAVPSTIVNGIWAVVAAAVLVKTGRARRAAKRAGTPEPTPVLHSEPVATTAVLPVIGPAVRDHEDEQAATTTTSATGAPDATVPGPAAPSLQAGPNATIPITGSIPVITAALALGLMKQAQEQQQAQHDLHRDVQDHAPAPHEAAHRSDV